MNAQSTWGKAKAPDYDPQVGVAAAANAATAARAQDQAERAQQFTEDYYNKYITPLIDQMVESSKSSTSRESELFDINKEQMLLARDRYKKYGIPAEDKYYDMVSKYSEPEEEARQAEGAIGDLRVAQQSQRGQLSRQYSSLGIDPTSPAAISAASDAAVMGTAAEAAAANRARNAARSLGMSLTSDAANFGRGGSSGILQFGGAASGNNQAGFGIANGSVAGVNAGAATPLAGAGVAQTGYGNAIRGYSSNLDAYTGLQKSAMEANAASSAGFGRMLGGVAGAFMGMPRIGG